MKSYTITEIFEDKTHGRQTTVSVRDIHFLIKALRQMQSTTCMFETEKTAERLENQLYDVVH